MKNLLQQPYSFIAFTLLVSSTMLSFLIPKPRHGPSSECTSSIQKEISYTFNKRKITDGKLSVSYSENHSTKTQKGLLELCLGNQGNCTWKITKNEIPILIRDISGMGVLMEYFQKELTGESVDYQDFIKTSIQAGAKITNLNNQTLSIRVEDQTKNIITVTLVDIKRNQLLGCSVYKDQDNLYAKLICKYGKGKLRIQETQLMYFEEQGPHQCSSKITVRHL